MASSTTFEYKPGYRVWHDGRTYHLAATLPDSWNPGATRLVTYALGGKDCDEDYREFLRRFEMHEVDEWAKRNGRRVRTPHGPGIDPDPG